MTRLLGDEPTKHSSNGDSRDREAWLVQVNELGARGEKLLMEQLPSELQNKASFTALVKGLAKLWDDNDSDSIAAEEDFSKNRKRATLPSDSNVIAELVTKKRNSQTSAP